MTDSIPCAIVTEGEHASHLDHVMSDEQREYALAQIRSGEATVKVGEFGPAFYIASVTLPESLGTVPCGLRGPLVGDAPIGESSVTYAKRGERPNESRLTDLPPLPSRELTAIVIGGNLATLYAGPLAPQETTDPFLRDDARAASEAFWAEHALSTQA
jgi:hypothetical protein